MRFRGLDLNLMFALKVLLEERNVSAAARRMNITQPALSGALARLRQSLGDELLVPFGRQMVPTPYAQTIAPVVDDLLSQIEARLLRAGAFDSATAARRFRLVASDYILAVLITPLMSELAARAPGISFEILAPDDTRFTGLDRGDVDVVFTPSNYASSGHPSILLFEERHLLLGWRSNPIFDEPLTAEALLRREHVVVEFGPQRRPSFAEWTMTELGHARRVAVSAPSFTAVPAMLPFTNRVAIVHERLAAIFEHLLPLASAELPFPFPPMREVIQYHTARESDAGLKWLIGELRDAAARPSLALDKLRR